MLSVTMTFALAACGDNLASNPTKNTTSGENASGKDDGYVYNVKYDKMGANGKDYTNYNPYEGIEKYKGTTVQFATWIDHQNTEGKRPIESFAKKYGIDVKLVYCSQNNYVSELLSLIAAGNSPDIYVENATFPTTLQVAQDFSVTGMDLNEPIWNQNAINSCRVGDKIYGVNTVNSVWGGAYLVFFNRELMESNGIKTPAEYYEEGNWTWDTMEQCMKQVDALGKDYYGGCIPDAFDLLSSLGIDPVTYDYKTGKFTNTITDQRIVKAMQYIAKLSKENLFTNQENFAVGRCGLIVKDPYGLKKTGYYRAMDGLDIGFTYMPDPDENTKATYGAGMRTYGIVKGSKNPKAAGMFIRYFLDPDNYDMSETFISTDAAKFYFELCNKVYETRNSLPFTYSYSGIAGMTGTSAWDWMKAGKEPAQVATLLAAQVNNVNAAVAKGNELTATMK